MRISAFLICLVILKNCKCVFCAQLILNLKGWRSCRQLVSIEQDSHLCVSITPRYLDTKVFIL